LKWDKIKMENNEKIELRSKEVQELIGKVPPKIVRIGIGVLFVFVTAIIILTFFLELPVYIKGPIKIEKDSSQINYFGYIKILPKDIIKIKINNPVYVNLEQFPENEYGILKTNVSKINPELITKNNISYYNVQVKFKKKSFNDIKIMGLKGTAEIEIERKKIFYKFFNSK